MNGTPKYDTLEIIETIIVDEITTYDVSMKNHEVLDLTSNIMKRVKQIIVDEIKGINDTPQIKLAAALKTICEHRASQEAIDLVSYSWRNSGRVDHAIFVNMTIGYLLGKPGLITDEAEIIRRDHAQGCYRDDMKLTALIKAYEGRKESS